MKNGNTRKRVSPRRESTYAQSKSNWHATKRILLISLLLLSVLGGIGYWTSHAVHEAIVNVYSTNLQTILDADIEALEIWVKNEIDYAKVHANDPSVSSEVEELIAIHRKYPGQVKKLLNSSNLSILQQKALPLQSDKDYLGFVVVDRTGYIVGSSIADPLIGMNLSFELENFLKRIFAGESILGQPHLQGEYVPGLNIVANNPVMITTAPVRNAEGNIIAALGLILNPDKDFTRILSVARMGESGDTYAFDREGFLISDSRFEDQLKEIGLLQDIPDTRSILAIEIRDPGGDMTRGYQPTIPLAERPLTRMAASAVSGQSGVDSYGYRDYRGVTVIGAWRWLPEYGFGVATEIPKSDAFAGHRPVKIAFIGIFSILFIGCLWFIYSSMSIHRLRNKIDKIKQLGQYRLLKKIGEGGMGKVYEAQHALLKRPTAVKFLKPEAMSEEAVQRFEQEVQLTSNLTHPNTIQIYDYGKTEDGIFYYAMEFLNGIDLAQLIEIGGKVPLERVIYILKHVCLSLDEAHSIGLIHRDIKPMNIMLCDRGGRYDTVKVLDFGLAKEINTPNELSLTTHQGIIGTPAYIAPERLSQGEDIDIRSDFYSLGSVAYNLITGEDVFIAPTSVEVCYHVMKTDPPRLSENVHYDIPASFDQLIADCLEKEAINRPSDAATIIAILESLEAEYSWDQEKAQNWWHTNTERINALRSTGS